MNTHVLENYSTEWLWVRFRSYTEIGRSDSDRIGANLFGKCDIHEILASLFTFEYVRQSKKESARKNHSIHELALQSNSKMLNQDIYR